MLPCLFWCAHVAIKGQRDRATGDCEKTLLRIRRQVGASAFRRPNRGLDCSFCCWTAGQVFAQKESCSSQTPVRLLDLRGFNPNIILTARGGILMSTGIFPEALSQQILVGIISAGRLGVMRLGRCFESFRQSQDKQGLSRSAAIPPNELSREHMGKMWQ